MAPIGRCGAIAIAAASIARHEAASRTYAAPTLVAAISTPPIAGPTIPVTW